MTKSKYEKDYLEADKYVVLNDNDPDLRPIVLSLPKPPPIHLIDGYGLPIEEQKFRRLEIPRRLIDLEAEAVNLTKTELATNKNNVVTLLKIQNKFWELVEDRHKELKKEIDFIRKVWWMRIHGMWFFNRGVPTYITGWHFWYLNFWTMDTDNGMNRPDFRSRDRKEFLFFQYANTTTETFARLDEYGSAIKEEDGTYKMKDLGKRVCYGTMQPKNRRSGNTHKSLSSGVEVLTRTTGTDGMGIQSYSENNAASHFKDKLMPAYNNLPIWLKPNTVSGRTSDTLKLDVGKNDYGSPSLGTYCDYATTASPKFYDGKKKIFLLTDESGKTSNVNVSDRHSVNKHTLAQGNGSQIFGTMFYPSTVEDLADGAYHYKKMANGSNFYDRIRSSGQTETGLFVFFVSGDEGLDGYIDSHGHSVKGELKDYQKAEGFTQTATEYLQGERDYLLKKGDSESMKSYRNVKKLFPLKFADCWLGEAGDLGFNIEKIDQRQAELRRDNPCIKGNMEWVGGIFGGDVEFIPDEENGRWTMSEYPPSHVINKKIEVTMFNPLTGKNEPQKRPMYGDLFVVGVDTFNFLGKSQIQAGKQSATKESKHSDGGMSVLLKYNEGVDRGKPMEEWDTHRFIMTYRNRHGTTYDFNEDVLKTCIYTGGMLFPEMNLTNTYEYFLTHGFAGYLLYRLNKFTGKYEEKPGIHSLETSKQDIFSGLRDYIEYRIHKDNMYDLQQELKEIKDMSAMRYFDLLASAGVALIGAQSQYVQEMFSNANTSYDLGDYMDFYDV